MRLAARTPHTAWAIVTGPPNNPKLVGGRATENEIDKLAVIWRRRLDFIQVTPVRELLAPAPNDPTLRRVLSALAAGRRGL